MMNLSLFSWARIIIMDNTKIRNLIFSLITIDTVLKNLSRKRMLF